MTTYKIVAQYCGKKYFGWQIQNDDTPTVQAAVNSALRKIFKEEIKTTGSGRTDAGVSSLDQHIVFKAPFEIPLGSLVKAVNSHLPDDIFIKMAEIVDDNFRPTNDAISKEYRYFFTDDSYNLPITRELMSYVRFDLNVSKMKLACEEFIGEHDFKNFHCLGSEPASTVRKITRCELVSVNAGEGGLLPNHYYIRIEGNGFLKQMVRLIVGAIWDVGRGKLEVSEIKKALESSEFKHIAPVAPALGLYKFKVEY